VRVRVSEREMVIERESGSDAGAFCVLCEGD
jgi:hypothetical protein